jgi:hypothetical protein
MLAAAGVIALIALGACVTQARPDDCGAPDVVRTLTISDRTLSPGDPAVCRGSEVTLEVTSDKAVVLHVHGYDAVAIEVPPDTPTAVSFAADRSGQFPIEIHPLESPQGVEIGILTVHEP